MKRTKTITFEEKNWSYLDVAIPGLDTFDPILPRWQETWECVCGARHTGKRRVIEKIESLSYSHYHAPKDGYVRT